LPVFKKKAFFHSAPLCTASLFFAKALRLQEKADRQEDTAQRFNNDISLKELKFCCSTDEQEENPFLYYFPILPDLVFAKYGKMGGYCVKAYCLPLSAVPADPSGIPRLWFGIAV
jgi:hypothetical protein